MEKYIDVIIGGPAFRGDNSLRHKAYTWTTIKECLMPEKDVKIIFKKEEMKYLNRNHDDALVISVRMINARHALFNAFQKL